MFDILLNAAVGGAGFVGGALFKEWRDKSRPIKRDKEVFDRLVTLLEKDKFIDNTQNRIWAGKFIFEELDAVHEVLNIDGRIENKFVDKKMENLRVILIARLNKLYRVLVKEFESAEITSLGVVHRPKVKGSDEEELSALLDEVGGLCDSVFQSYQKLYTVGHKTFGDRL